ncbi:transposase [Janthinobacterium aquaticum]|uniref:transposase n=1 Tax=Janthinobacterium sp. FT58W TaxID=2654254 RepID=UPI001265A513|nr:transposase [Janthinobacterium sp. FT58W]KAB8041161.1 transposase [Janthinobacterium sp. FT58W]
MARLPRLIIPSLPHYVIQRGANRQPVFQDADDHVQFLAWLKTGAKTFKVALHAYVLLPDQLHLLATPSDATGLAQLMQWLGRYYVPYFNQKYGREGTLWQGRYKTAVIDAEHFFLLCCRYLEYVPVRTGLVGHERDHGWSSYAHHVGLRPDALITDHALYWALGNTPFDREGAYLRLCEQGLSGAQIKAVEQAVLKGWPLGSDAFKQALELKMQRQVLPAKRGRPRKSHQIPPHHNAQD